MPPQDLDVNVHPTKKEVHFLHEEEVLALLHARLTHTLRSSNDSRHFQVQTVLNFADSSSSSGSGCMGATSSYSSNTNSRRSAGDAGSNTTATPTTTSNTSVYSTSSMFLQTPAPLPLSAMERAAGTLTTPTTTQEQDQQGQEQSKEGLQNPDDEEAEFDFSQAGNRDYLTSKRPRLELIQSGFNTNSIENINNDTILLEEEVLFDSNQQENTRNTNLSSHNTLISINNDNIKSTKTVIAPKKLVRTDPSLVKIDSVFKPSLLDMGRIEDEGNKPSLLDMGRIEEEGNKPEEMAACECETPLFTPTGIIDTTVNTTEKIDDQMGEDVEDSELEVTGTDNTGEAMIYAGFCNDSGSIIPNMSCLCCGGGRFNTSTAAGRGGSSARSKWRELAVNGDAESANINSSNTTTAAATITTTAAAVRLSELIETHCRYESIQTLLTQIKDSHSIQLKQMLHNYTFVGTIDCYFSVIQYETKLLLIDHSNLIQDLMYQIIIRRFGELDMYILSEPLDICELINIGLNNEEKEKEEIIIRKERIHDHNIENNEENNQKKKERTDKIALIYNFLCSKSALLLEYFNIDINITTGKLYSIPIVLTNYTPFLDTLPLLLLNLVREVNWESEIECFHSIAVCLAEFYSYLRTEPIGENNNNNNNNNNTATATTVVATTTTNNNINTTTTTDATITSSSQCLPKLTQESERLLTGTLYPALRAYLLPSKKHSNNGTVSQIAALEQLYKVFERC